VSSAIEASRGTTRISGNTSGPLASVGECPIPRFQRGERPGPHHQRLARADHHRQRQGGPASAITPQHGIGLISLLSGE
jgi:hypothetical protein